MKKMYKAMALVLCAVLLVAGSVMGTLAYLQMQTAPIKNTMTVGKVKISLNESKVTPYGVVDGNTKVTENSYKLIPGHTYVKDPTIHVEVGSESCYLFVDVVNEISEIEDASATIAGQMTANGWTKLGDNGTVWYKATAVDAREAAVDVAVFTNFKIDGTKDITGYANKTIKITAYAVQADGFATAQAAWDASGFGSDN